MSKGISTNIILLLVTACLALGVMWVTWNHTTNNLSWTMMRSPDSYNASVSSVDSVFGIMPMILGIVIVLIVVSIVLTYLYFPADHIKSSKYLDWFLKSIYYFAYGMLGIICFAPPYMLGRFLFDYLFVQGNTGSMVFILQTIGIFILAYFVIAVFGYFFKKIIFDKVKSKWDEHHPVEEVENVTEG